jgi:hypothetical protein
MTLDGIDSQRKKIAATILSEAYLKQLHDLFKH